MAPGLESIEHLLAYTPEIYKKELQETPWSTYSKLAWHIHELVKANRVDVLTAWRDSFSVKIGEWDKADAAAVKDWNHYLNSLIEAGSDAATDSSDRSLAFLNKLLALLLSKDHEESAFPLSPTAAEGRERMYALARAKERNVPFRAGILFLAIQIMAEQREKQSAGFSAYQKLIFDTYAEKLMQQIDAIPAYSYAAFGSGSIRKFVNHVLQFLLALIEANDELALCLGPSLTRFDKFSFSTTKGDELSSEFFNQLVACVEKAREAQTRAKLTHVESAVTVPGTAVVAAAGAGVAAGAGSRESGMTTFSRRLSDAAGAVAAAFLGVGSGGRQASQGSVPSAGGGGSGAEGVELAVLGGK